MIRSTFEEGIEQILTVQPSRKLTDKQRNLIFEKLCHITDMDFMKILDEYLDEVPCPQNIIGYFRGRNSPTEKALEFDPNAGWKGGEYTAEDQALLAKCRNKAAQLFKNKGAAYQDWCGLFNKKWLELAGSRLTDYLRRIYEGLCKEES